MRFRERDCENLNNLIIFILTCFQVTSTSEFVEDCLALMSEIGENRYW